MKRYVEFVVWNIKEERNATEKEIEENVSISIIENGKCIITTEDGYSVYTE